MSRDQSPSVVDCAVYRDGRRIASPGSPRETAELLDQDPSCFAWLGLFRPSHDEIKALAGDFNLPALAVEDTIVAHQRPKVERYGEIGFMVLRSATFHADTIRLGELHVFASSRFVITVRHAESPDLALVRRRLEQAPDRLVDGPQAVLMQVLDVVVDGYAPVIDSVGDALDEIELQVYSGSERVSKRIYRLSRQLLDLQHAVRPLGTIISQLRGDALFAPSETSDRHALRDIEDHAIVINDHVERLREALKGNLDLTITLTSQRQNEEMKALTEASLRQAEDSRRIAAWAGVLFVPTLVAGIYGMNFERMPELHWAFGYPLALLLMVLAATGMYAVFKTNRWL
ncbi:MAG: magnesium and cobalt transport protein CorA [Arachnia sp.]